MRPYIKWLLVVIAVLLPLVIVARRAVVYFSEENQQRHVSGTVVHHGVFDIDIDSLRNALEPCADSLASMVRLCEQVQEGIIERASKGMIVEICNNSLYQVDYSKWGVNGYWSGRSSTYDALDKRRAPIDESPFDARQRILERMNIGAILIGSDKILTRGECYTVRRGGDFTPYDSLEVVLTEVRLNGAPW